ncbi:MAG: Zn-dependent hydrolase [Bacteroidetes bacterium]|nr:Zn-dependent hydrolase [Bacteroidota bacterium]MBU1580473.1 Zn-dependent hydrolase [Bacteroidota bacterium]MBU2464719.1 Zn-dependent hydrolase [Bacteroidota bacterium]MBU2557495.1 Zn-dependent hydrolase [Bacteroidota bacterium]
MKKLSFMLGLLLMLGACEQPATNTAETPDPMTSLMEKYAEVPLTADISHLSDDEKEMLQLLFKAATIMDDIFWLQNFGEKIPFLSSIENAKAREFAAINYGPWDELDNQKPFLDSYGPKPQGAQFYPEDMTVEEFNAFDDPNKTSQYTLIRRDEEGALKTVWYHEAYAKEINEAADLLDKAAELAGDKAFADYLRLRATALRTDEYFESDMAWMDVRNNNVDLVIGPIENYTDALFGYKAAHEAFILIKDKVWSDRLSHYAAFLPELQTQLPVDQKYKNEVPGSDADLNAYDVVFYGGDCNMAGKTIAINLPNDERVQLEKGTRKLQLKNSMRAKFDQILVPISQELIDPQLRQHIKFDAFFSNTMFHEVAHGMGIKNTIDGKSTVRKALREQYSAIEEAKADILGLFLVTKLHEMGEYQDTELMDNYVTFMAGFFRSVRFGAASAHGKANMLTFNFFREEGGFTRSENGTYSIDLEKMKAASAKLTGMILKVQGDGDYEAVKSWIANEGVVKQQLQADLDRITALGIPVDIYFKMGPEMLGLK